ncbi:aminoacyl-tRNA hydrolase [Olsenella sp. An290]|uniref:aminoacyl-tRNA hydrolase n=1 Tax=Olsenella sp. An290 TaxID=1965625 RepID=UPI000B377FBC|nr:aminoacyl-tRNA hydrolase [Olsenella sp. An290]OUO32614.1 aminoacyl-tRNA hydrolase [Olsenella sp. An290]
MPSSSYLAKQMIVMRRDLKMRKGKIAAQAGHACVEATLMALAREGRGADVRATQEWAWLEHAASDRTPLTDWFDAGVAKVCVYVDSEEALLDLARRGRELGFAVALVRDAGHTEFHGEPTYTCLAFEPLPAEKIDPLTGELPLF